MKAVIGLLLIFVVTIAGCTSTVSTGPSEKSGDNMMEKGNQTMSEEGAMMENKSSMYFGTVLAGSASPIIDFNMADYKSVSQERLVLLYFYANWCSVCRQEVPEMYAAFNEIESGKVIGFRVNFNDDQTDSDEVSLARQYGVPYQHTKVMLKNGQVLLKSSESWNKARYLLEINKALNMQ